jgi:hypothetical protein
VAPGVGSEFEPQYHQKKKKKKKKKLKKNLSPEEEVTYARQTELKSKSILTSVFNA